MRCLPFKLPLLSGFVLLSFLLTFQNGVAQKGKTKQLSKYDFEGPLFNNRGRVMQNHLWGFIDNHRSVVIGLKYNEVENFNDGIAKVRKGHFWGLIDTTGTIIVPIAFDWIADFVGDRAKVITKGEKAYIDRKGNVVGR